MTQRTATSAILLPRPGWIHNYRGIITIPAGASYDLGMEKGRVVVVNGLMHGKRGGGSTSGFDEAVRWWQLACCRAVTGFRPQQNDTTLVMDKAVPLAGRVILFDLLKLPLGQFYSGGLVAWLLWQRRYIDSQPMALVTDHDVMGVGLDPRVYRCADWSKACAAREECLPD